MTYWKVWAKCCKAVEPISRIYDYSIDGPINVLLCYAANQGIFKTPDEMKDARKKAWKCLHENGILNCGDFCIVIQDEKPTERPVMCGHDTWIFED